MIELNIENANSRAILVKSLRDKLKDTVVVCIGTEKVVADSIGPRVGTLINENLLRPMYVYGLQGANIHAQNLSQALCLIKRLHPNSPLLVVDAAVGESDQVGKVQLSFGNITPGAATNKRLEKVGDVSIVGIVSHKDMANFYDNSVEQSILAERLSQFIAMSIITASKEISC